MRRCAHPHCANLVKGKGRHCNQHKARKTPYQRDPEVQAFYQSDRWQRVRKLKLAKDPCCEVCQLKGVTTPAVMVHHSLSIKKVTEESLNIMYLVSLCHACHNQIETELEGQTPEGGAISGERKL